MTLPRRRTWTFAGLVIALLAGLVAMHGLTGSALASARPATAGQADSWAMPDHAAAAHDRERPTEPVAPNRNGPHHGPAAGGHHPCMAALAASAPVLSPPTPAAPAAAAAPAAPAADVTPARARPDRAPPDLNDLCVSRT